MASDGSPARDVAAFGQYEAAVELSLGYEKAHARPQHAPIAGRREVRDHESPMAIWPIGGYPPIFYCAQGKG